MAGERRTLSIQMEIPSEITSPDQKMEWIRYNLGREIGEGMITKLLEYDKIAVSQCPHGHDCVSVNVDIIVPPTPDTNTSRWRAAAGNRNNYVSARARDKLAHILSGEEKLTPENLQEAVRLILSP